MFFSGKKSLLVHWYSLGIFLCVLNLPTFTLQAGARSELVNTLAETEQAFFPRAAQIVRDMAPTGAEPTRDRTAQETYEFFLEQIAQDTAITERQRVAIQNSTRRGGLQDYTFATQRGREFILRFIFDDINVDRLGTREGMIRETHRILVDGNEHTRTSNANAIPQALSLMRQGLERVGLSGSSAWFDETVGGLAATAELRDVMVQLTSVFGGQGTQQTGLNEHYLQDKKFMLALIEKLENNENLRLFLSYHLAQSKQFDSFSLQVGMGQTRAVDSRKLVDFMLKRHRVSGYVNDILRQRSLLEEKDEETRKRFTANTGLIIQYLVGGSQQGRRALSNLRALGQEGIQRLIESNGLGLTQADIESLNPDSDDSLLLNFDDDATFDQNIDFILSNMTPGFFQSISDDFDELFNCGSKRTGVNPKDMILPAQVKMAIKAQGSNLEAISTRLSSLKTLALSRQKTQTGMSLEIHERILVVKAMRTLRAQYRSEYSNANQGVGKQKKVIKTLQKQLREEAANKRRKLEKEDKPVPVELEEEELDTVLQHWEPLYNKSLSFMDKQKELRRLIDLCGVAPTIALVGRTTRLDDQKTEIENLQELLGEQAKIARRKLELEGTPVPAELEEENLAELVQTWNPNAENARDFFEMERELNKRLELCDVKATNEQFRELDQCQEEIRTLLERAREFEGSEKFVEDVDGLNAQSNSRINFFQGKKLIENYGKKIGELKKFLETMSRDDGRDSDADIAHGGGALSADDRDNGCQSMHSDAYNSGDEADDLFGTNISNSDEFGLFGGSEESNGTGNFLFENTVSQNEVISSLYTFFGDKVKERDVALQQESKKHSKIRELMSEQDWAQQNLCFKEIETHYRDIQAEKEETQILIMSLPGEVAQILKTAEREMRRTKFENALGEHREFVHELTPMSSVEIPLIASQCREVDEKGRITYRSPAVSFFFPEGVGSPSKIGFFPRDVQKAIFLGAQTWLDWWFYSKMNHDRNADILSKIIEDPDTLLELTKPVPSLSSVPEQNVSKKKKKKKLSKEEKEHQEKLRSYLKNHKYLGYNPLANQSGKAMLGYFACDKIVDAVKHNACKPMWKTLGRHYVDSFFGMGDSLSSFKKKMFEREFQEYKESFSTISVVDLVEPIMRPQASGGKLLVKAVRGASKLVSGIGGFFGQKPSIYQNSLFKVGIEGVAFYLTLKFLDSAYHKAWTDYVIKNEKLLHLLLEEYKKAALGIEQVKEGKVLHARSLTVLRRKLLVAEAKLNLFIQEGHKVSAPTFLAQLTGSAFWSHMKVMTNSALKATTITGALLAIPVGLYLYKFYRDVLSKPQRQAQGSLAASA